MLRALIGFFLLLHHHMAAALPGWASGNVEIDGDLGWMTVVLTAGLLGAIGINKELATTHTPMATHLVKWIGRAAVAAVLYVIIVAPFSYVDTHVCKVLLGAWSIAKASHALYVAGLEAGLRVDAEMCKTFHSHPTSVNLKPPLSSPSQPDQESAIPLRHSDHPSDDQRSPDASR